MPIHETIALGINLATDIFGLFDSGTKGPTRADWAMLDLQRKSAEASMTKAQAMQMMQTAALPGPAYTAPIAAPMPVSQGAYISMTPAMTGAGMMPASEQDSVALVTTGLTDDLHTLKNLVSFASEGATIKALQVHARERKFTLAKYRKIVAYKPFMDRLWQAMGGKWLRADMTFQRASYLRMINEALRGMRGKKRGMSLRTMKRAAKQAKDWKKVFKELGIDKSPKVIYSSKKKPGC